MSLQLISQDCKITKVEDATANGTDDVESASVDMAGWEGVIFITSFGTAAANNLIHAECSSDDGVADAFADIEGSEVDASGASDEDQYIEILFPPERYVRCEALRGTSSPLGDIWAIQFRAKNKPASSLLSGTIYGKSLNAPAVGTK